MIEITLNACIMVRMMTRIVGDRMTSLNVRKSRKTLRYSFDPCKSVNSGIVDLIGVSSSNKTYQKGNQQIYHGPSIA